MDRSEFEQDQATFESLVARIPAERAPASLREWWLETFPVDPHIAVEELCHFVRDQFPEMLAKDRGDLLLVATRLGFDRARYAGLLTVD